MLDHFTDNEGPFEITKDLDKTCWEHSIDALKVEMEAFSKQLTTAISKYNTKLDRSSHGEVRPIARGGKPGHDAQESIAELDGLRRLEIMNRICLAPTEQLKKDLKLKIEDSNVEMKKIGNPITYLATVTRHDIKTYSEMEQQLDWEDTAGIVIKHLLARCGIGNDMTDIVRKLDMWSAKKTDDISDTNQEYTDMILDLSGLWDDKKRTATKGCTPEDTEKWETEWWARHMAHNEGEEASDVTRLRSNKAQMDPNAPKEHVPYNVPGEIPEALASKPWARDSFHVAEYVMCRTTGYSIPIFRSGFNANRRFNDRDFNTYTSTKIIFDNMNMLPAPNGAPKGPVPRHMDIVPPVERQERTRHRAEDRGQPVAYRGSQRDTRHHLDRYQNQSRYGGHDYEPRSRDQPPHSFAPSSMGGR